MSALKFPPLKPEDVEVRVGTCNEKGASLLLYKTARTDMAMLDGAVGPENWQKRYEVVDGKLFCSVGIRFGDGEWVWKQDVGTPSNMEADKGQASDAFKRAGFCWGIGRELYTAPFIWVGKDACNIRKGRNGKLQCYDDFRVTEMEVEGGQIVKLAVANMSRRGQVVYGARPQNRERPDDPVQAAKQRLWRAAHVAAPVLGKSPEEVVEDLKASKEWDSQHGSAEWLNAKAAALEKAAANG